MNLRLVFGAVVMAVAVGLALPASAHDHRHHYRHHHAGGYGLGVAPGGGRYTKRDIINESTFRMSRPHVGEPAAPSVVARGPHRHINRVEMILTAKLNLHQLHRRRW